MPLKVYDETISVLKSAVRKARLGRDEELGAIQRLDEQARLVEASVASSGLEAVVAVEFANSHVHGGRSVYGWEPDHAATRPRSRRPH